MVKSADTSQFLLADVPSIFSEFDKAVIFRGGGGGTLNFVTITK